MNEGMVVLFRARGFGMDATARAIQGRSRYER